MSSETIVLEGHIIDSLMLPKVLDEIVEAGASYEIQKLDIGTTNEDTSRARILVRTDDDEGLTELLARLQTHGANPETSEDADFATADRDGSFPPGFYSTTNLDTEIRIDGRWIPVRRTEMDCGIVMEEGRARTVPMAEVEKDMNIVLAGRGIRVHPVEKPRDVDERASFEFMSSGVSSEKPKALLVEQVAHLMEEIKGEGKRILWVVGPALIHTGSAPDLCALIRGGFVDALFAGNGVAAHDIESHMFGTSLGIHLDQGIPAEYGHEHHIRALNELRRHGSFEAAIDAGLFTDGIVYHLVKDGRPYLFGGSVRDDGPSPETVYDMLEVQTRLRDMIWGENDDDLVGMCIVAGTMLHGIAAGNCLPASVPLVCVDINQATVTKLMDRGSWQSMGIITDIGLFVRELAETLTPEEIRPPAAEARERRAGSRTRR